MHRILRLLFITALFFCSSHARAEKVYRHILGGHASTLDPTQAGNVFGTPMISAVLDRLYDYKALRPYELKPSLAAAMPQVSADRRVYTITLRKNVFFQDDPCFQESKGKGREVRAQDFVYAMKRHFDPKNSSSARWLWREKIVGLDAWGAQGADYASEVAGLKALDSHTVQITTKENFPQLLHTLAMSFASVLPREAVDYYKGEFGRHPVGSGPFRLVSLSAQKGEFVKNPTYREEIFDANAEGCDEKTQSAWGVKNLDGRRLPFLDRLEVLFIAQAETRWRSFNKGNEGQYIVLSSRAYEQVLQSTQPVVLREPYQSKFHFSVMRDLTVNFSEFNMAHPDFGDHPDPVRRRRNHALRCALRKAWDWPTRLKRRTQGLGEVFPGIIPPGLEGFDPQLGDDSVRLDREGAKKLLRENDWRADNLPVLTYAGVASVDHRHNFSEFRSWLVQIGYPAEKVRLREFANFPDYLKDMKKGVLNFHSDLLWFFDFPDAANILQLYFSANAAPGMNHANYANETFDRLFTEASAAEPGSAREALYRQANRILVDDCVFIGSSLARTIHLWHKNVTLVPNQGNLGSFFKYVDVAN